MLVSVDCKTGAVKSLDGLPEDRGVSKVVPEIDAAAVLSALIKKGVLSSEDLAGLDT